MPTPNETYKQYGQQPFYYVNGLRLSNDATTPLEIINVSAGTILDSSATYQLGSTAVMKADIRLSGLGGLDTGTVAASSVYAVYLVSDPVSAQPSGVMFSLNQSLPLLPFDYSAYALLGFVTTDSSSHILAGYWSDNDAARRLFTFDAPIICLTGGTSGTYAGVALTTFVPAIANLAVTIYSSFTANAAADVLKMQGYLSTGDAVTIVAPVAGATAHTTSQNVVLAQLNSGAPSIKYTVSAGAVSLYVCGYTFDL